MSDIINYKSAVNVIKTAILQSQARAAKAVNQEQLALYFGIGRYVSANTRKKNWGKGAIEAISSQLRAELPGLRGFSATSMRNMRAFYEEWRLLESNSSVTTDEIQLLSSKPLSMLMLRGEDVVKDVVKELSERQIVILQLITLDSVISAKTISEKISEKGVVDARTIQRDLAKLKKLGILTRKGGRKDGEWLLTELGQRVLEESSKEE